MFVRSLVLGLARRLRKTGIDREAEQEKERTKNLRLAHQQSSVESNLYRLYQPVSPGSQGKANAELIPALSLLLLDANTLFHPGTTTR